MCCFSCLIKNVSNKKNKFEPLPSTKVFNFNVLENREAKEGKEVVAGELQRGIDKMNNGLKVFLQLKIRK